LFHDSYNVPIDPYALPNHCTMYFPHMVVPSGEGGNEIPFHMVEHAFEDSMLEFGEI